MPEYFQKFIVPIVGSLAAVLGWVLISIPKVAQRTMTWTLMLSSIGVAAVVGFVVGAVVSYFWPNLPSPMMCSISAVVGAGCDQWITRFMQFANRAADRLENTLLDEVGEDTHKDQHPAEHTPPDAEFEEKPPHPQG